MTSALFNVNPLQKAQVRDPRHDLRPACVRRVENAVTALDGVIQAYL